MTKTSANTPARGGAGREGLVPSKSPAQEEKGLENSKKGFRLRNKLNKKGE